MADKQKAFRGDRLREIRKQRGLTQEELNTRLGFGNTQLHRYEIGKAEPSADVLKRLAKELEVSTDWLLGLSDLPLGNLQESDLSVRESKVLEAFRRRDLLAIAQQIAIEDSEPEH